MPEARHAWIASTPSPDAGWLVVGRKTMTYSTKPMPASQNASKVVQMNRAYALYF
jgi:hypothetical protein